MKTDGLFQKASFEYKFSSYGKPITLFVISDIHRNSPSCDSRKWKEFLDEARSVPDALFLFNGDIIDSFSTSERKAFLGNEFHDSSTKRLEEMVVGDIKSLVKECEFMRGRILGILGGNHYFNFAAGMTSDQFFAHCLGAKYLGVNAIIRLYLRYKGFRSHKYDICAHHGLGGGRSCGASINKLQSMANHFECDALIMGHDHNRAVDYINRLSLEDCTNGEPKLVNKRILLARSGSFLKAYEPGQASYVVDAGLPPADLGALRISITPMREEKRKAHPDYEDKRWLSVEATI